jgi:hypothetical protein
MEPYIEKWFNLIQGMSNDNTYKLAWGRSIIEYVSINEASELTQQIEITFQDIAQNILKYYWNQIFFFDLLQSANKQKLPVIYQVVKELINYYIEHNSNIPVWFNKAELFFKKHNTVYYQTIDKIAHALKSDVSWRFLYANGITYDVYKLNQNKTSIFIQLNKYQLLREYGEIIIQLLNYKWAQLLEKYNRAPRIVSKIKGSQDNQIRRSSLNRFKEVLLKQFDNNQVTDFYSGDILPKEEISIDHVIPWSFLYSDDIWNLVITSKSNNSKKSNHKPSRDVIDKLLKRNIALMDRIDDPALKDELLLSVEHDYVTRYYYDLIS